MKTSEPQDIDFRLQEKKIETLEKTINELSNKLILLTRMIGEQDNKKSKKGVTLDISDIVSENVEKIVENNSSEQQDTDGPTFE